MRIADGRGPHLVLVPAGPGDSETTWRFVLPRLPERFTCHAMDTRGVLLLHGSRTHPAFVEMVRHVAEHAAHPQVREVPGAGHFGVYTEPEAVTDELARFFAANLARA